MSFEHSSIGTEPEGFVRQEQTGPAGDVVLWLPTAIRMVAFCENTLRSCGFSTATCESNRARGLAGGPQDTIGRAIRADEPTELG
jgi:hypothetical protein